MEGEKQMEDEGSQFSTAGEAGEHHALPCAPCPAAIQDQGSHQNWFSWGHSEQAVLGAALWTSALPAQPFLPT